jgi:LysM repeat protein
MAARSRWRYLAPFALLAVIVVTGLVIRSGLSKTHTVSTQQTTAATATGHRHKHKRFYVVKAGDTLSGISAKTGVSITTIEALNPAVDPGALQAGQRLKLTR